MDDRSRELPRNVPIRTRIIAFCWDYLLISGYLLVLVGVAMLAEDRLKPLFTENALLAELTGFLFLTLPVYLYFAISEGSKAHATWGKRKTGIEVAGVSGRPVGIGTSLYRSALKFVPWELAHFTVWHMVIPTEYPDYAIYALLGIVYGLALVYLIGPLWSRNKRTVYDAIAGTVVRYKA